VAFAAPAALAAATATELAFSRGRIVRPRTPARPTSGAAPAGRGRKQGRTSQTRAAGSKRASPRSGTQANFRHSEPGHLASLPTWALEPDLHHPAQPWGHAAAAAESLGPRKTRAAARGRAHGAARDAGAGGHSHVAGAARQCDSKVERGGVERRAGGGVDHPGGDQQGFVVRGQRGDLEDRRRADGAGCGGRGEGGEGVSEGRMRLRRLSLHVCNSGV
jgi:hypothetical protein